jgi:hypothetical protein
MGDTSSAGDGGTRDSVRQGWEERIPKAILFSLPSSRKGKEPSLRRVPRVPAARLSLPRHWLGWLSSPLTAPSSVARPSACIWRSSSSSSAAAGAGTPGWGPPDLALPPARARPPPATYRPRLAPSPRLRVALTPEFPPLQSSDLPASPRGRK